MEHQFRLAEIEVNKSTMDEKIIGLFRYESEAKNKRATTLLILVEMNSTLYVYEQLLDVINATAEQARHLTAAFEGDPMARFEKLIQRLNDAVTDFIQQEPTPIAWNRLNMFVVELSESHVCLSGIGRLTNILLQKQPDGQFRTFDLFGSLEQPVEVMPQKPFASLICGDIHPGDVLFFGTQNFERLRDEINLVPRLTTLPAVTAALEIQQDIEGRNIPDDFAGVIVVNVPLPQSSPAPSKISEPMPQHLQEKSTQSIKKMHQEEEEAQAMLSPSMPLTHASKFADRKKRYLLWLTTRLTQLWRDVCAWKKNRTASIKDPMALASLRSLHAGHGSFMTKKRKFTIFLCVAALVVIVGGTLSYRYARRASAEQTLWNMARDQALDKKNRADADLVYGNEQEARRLLQEANDILWSLDEKTKGRKQAKAELQQGIREIQNKLKHEKVIDHLTEIAAPTGGDLRAITLWNHQVFVADKNNGALWRINPDTREQKRITLPTADSSPMIIAATTDKDSILLLTETRDLFSINPIDDTVTPLLLAVKRAKSLTSTVIYNRRLYVLDPIGNMVWKYSRAENAFAQESPYLKQNTNNLNEASSIAIDANVYVAFKNGKITRYLSGVEEPWTLPAIDPPLTNAGGIWTDIDTDRLVLTDPVEKRIIVIRKDGQLIAQIISPEFQNPRDVVGDVANKKIYVLDGQRVVALDLP
ncbi:MAG: hypothetical protein Q7N87_02345 [Candidatus Uhrbacteria bacterium]|nr:hypothetical protein [Candidatus Uhrbacteria bacterium]